MKKYILILVWIVASLMSAVIIRLGVLETFIVAFGIPLIISWYLSYVVALWKSVKAIKLMKNLAFSPANVTKMLKDIDSLKTKKADKKENKELKEEDNAYGMYR